MSYVERLYMAIKNTNHKNLIDRKKTTDKGKQDCTAVAALKGDRYPDTDILKCCWEIATQTYSAAAGVKQSSKKGSKYVGYTNQASRGNSIVKTLTVRYLKPMIHLSHYSDNSHRFPMQSLRMLSTLGYISPD